MLKLQSVCVLIIASLSFVAFIGAGNQSMTRRTVAAEVITQPATDPAMRWQSLASAVPHPSGIEIDPPDVVYVTPTPEPTPEPTPAAMLALAVVQEPPPRVVREQPVVAARVVAPVSSGRAVSAATFYDVAAAVGLPATSYMLSIAMCESGYDSNADGYKDTLDAGATGRAGERGVMQIHPTHAARLIPSLGYTWDQMYEVGPNLAVAAVLFQAGGYSPWSCA